MNITIKKCVNMKNMTKNVEEIHFYVDIIIIIMMTIVISLMLAWIIKGVD